MVHDTAGNLTMHRRMTLKKLPAYQPAHLGKVLPDGRQRVGIFPGARVKIVQKKDQGTGAMTEGRVQEILTRSPFHPHGIKVRLEDGSVGRVREVV